MVAVPETRYVKSGDVHIAYQVIGDGPLDLVFVPGFVSNIEALWNEPMRASFFRRLASFSRLILFDKRGTGMSDRSSQVFSLEQRMEDVHAVMDAAGSQRAALFGLSEGGPMSLLFAASYPQRTSALVLYGSYAKRSWAPDYPYGWKDEKWEAVLANIERSWGTPQGIDLNMWAPSIANDEARAAAAAAYFRAGASPGAVLAVMKMNREIDVRHVLSSVHVPTLIIHRVGDRVIDIEHARYLGLRILQSKLVELPGIDHMPWIGDSEAILQEIEEFMTGARHVPDPERILATVLFTDIVESTERAAALGDRKWRELLEGYQSLVRQQLGQFRGREIDTAGDGFLAAFDGPARAIRCAAAVREQSRSQGIDIRAGLHTGECEIMGEKLGGIAVHIGSRVAAKAAPGEIVVSQTVKDLVAGSGLSFADRGAHALKGVPGEWRLYAFVN
jgi:pimeloyl-ACP methyl ester carboxylesterase/class 3 adenylate cyclase